MHILDSSWSLWIHYVTDPDWSIPSYIKVHSCSHAEELIALHETVVLSECVFRKCMLFFMKDSIMPIWEDDENKNGGYFSFKLALNNIRDTWATVIYMMAGNTISDNPEFISDITGIVLSPKKYYYNVQIWMKTKTHTKSEICPDLNKIIKDEIIFKQFGINR
jgi:hypothetical protein